MDANIPSEYLGPFQEALLEDGYLVRYAGHDPENSGKWRAIFKVLKGFSRSAHADPGYAVRIAIHGGSSSAGNWCSCR